MLDEGFKALEINNLLESRDKIRQQIDNEYAQIDNLSAEKNKIIDDISALKNAYTQILSDCQDAQNKLDSLTLDVEKCGIIRDEIASENKAIDRQIAEKKKLLHKLSTDILTIKKEFDVNSKKINDVISSLEKQKQSLMIEIKNNDEINKKLLLQNSEYVAQNNLIDSLNNEINQKREELKQLNKLIINLKLTVLTGTNTKKFGGS